MVIVWVSDDCKSRAVSSNQAGRPQEPGYGGRNEDPSAEYQLPDYTEPEPTRWPRPPKEEGEAA